MGRKRTNYEFSNVPKSWNDITLKKFQELSRLYKEHEQITDIKLIAFFTDKKEEYIKDAPVAVINVIMQYLDFINQPLDDTTTATTITINDTEYQINTQDELKFGEYVDVQTVLKDNEENLAAVLGILCRKKDEEYNDEYIAKILPERIKMYEEMPIVEVKPLINFFLECCLQSAIHIQQSSIKNLANQQVQHIANFLKNGDGKKRSILWRMRTLQKLKQYKKAILQL